MALVLNETASPISSFDKKSRTATANTNNNANNNGNVGNMKAHTAHNAWVVKAQFEDDLRRFNLPSMPTWDVLNARLLDLFHVADRSCLIVKYKDEEGDLITCSSEDELRQAMAMTSIPNLLRVYITIKSSSAATSPRQQQQQQQQQQKQQQQHHQPFHHSNNAAGVPPGLGGVQQQPPASTGTVVRSNSSGSLSDNRRGGSGKGGSSSCSGGVGANSGGASSKEEWRRTKSEEKRIRGLRKQEEEQVKRLSKGLAAEDKLLGQETEKQIKEIKKAIKEEKKNGKHFKKEEKRHGHVGSSRNPMMMPHYHSPYPPVIIPPPLGFASPSPQHPQPHATHQMAPIGSQSHTSSSVTSANGKHGNNNVGVIGGEQVDWLDQRRAWLNTQQQQQQQQHQHHYQSEAWRRSNVPVPADSKAAWHMQNQSLVQHPHQQPQHHSQHHGQHSVQQHQHVHQQHPHQHQSQGHHHQQHQQSHVSPSQQSQPQQQHSSQQSSQQPQSQQPGSQQQQQVRNLRARFVKHVTIPDGTEIRPHTAFTKTWKFRNEGPFPWPAGCRLLFISKLNGDRMGGPESVPVVVSASSSGASGSGVIQVGDEVEVSVPLVAPASEGRYVGFWRLCSPSGRKFGQRVWVKVDVVNSSTSSSSSASIAQQQHHHYVAQQQQHYTQQQQLPQQHQPQPPRHHQLLMPTWDLGVGVEGGYGGLGSGPSPHHLVQQQHQHQSVSTGHHPHHHHHSNNTAQLFGNNNGVSVDHAAAEMELAVAKFFEM